MSGHALSRLGPLARVIGELASDLDPEGLHARLKEVERGGFPASAMPSGSPSAESKLPLPDQLDRRLNTDRASYSQILREVRRLLGQAVTLQNDWMEPAPPAPPLCENRPACINVLEKDRQSGECQRCRQWRSRNGVPYPQRSDDDSQARMVS